MTWTPLHVHSHYSILDALGSPKEIIEKAAELQLKALALTDHGNAYGAIEFYKGCISKNIKPIFGSDVYMAPLSCDDKNKQPGMKAAYSLVLLAKNNQGYTNLCKLVSYGFTKGFYYFPRIDKALLEEHLEGLVCLSSGLNSFFAHLAINESIEKFESEISWYQSRFKEDFYLELQRPFMSEADIQKDGMHQESWLVQNYYDYEKKFQQYNDLLMETSKKFSIPLVATNDTHYIKREDWKAHEILLNIQSGEPCEIWEKDSLGNAKKKIPNPKRRIYSSHEFYFKSPDQMKELFSDIPNALEQTNLIVDKCDVRIDFETKHYPVFLPPNLENKNEFTEKQRVEESHKFLLELCEKGIESRYTPDNLAKVQEQYPDQDPIQVVRDRLQKEIDIIFSKDMCDYILIVYDFLHWAKKNNIPVGPGRGSGAGSIILYLIGITDIEPLRFNLFFERFINPERLSYPDIDVDICMDKRSKVIEYTLNKYGNENVAQIITFGTMKAKMSIKDVGRVLSVPLAKVNDIAKLVPDDLNMTLEKALHIDPDLKQLYETDFEAKQIIDMGQILEGSIRNTGIHAAGVVVCGENLTDYIPVCLPKGAEMLVTQFSMKPLEAVGMLKMDFLGLKTLTCIQKAVDAIYEDLGKTIDWMNLPLDDEPTYQLLRAGQTLGVFQLESGGMVDLAMKLGVDKFEEIIAAIALYRPGPMDMIPSFINRKHGLEKIEIDHPWMEEILKETYGVMVYQEQVMQIAQKLANYSLGEGDVLRRAMGKKDLEEMARQREKFYQGCVENKISEETAEVIFDKMEKFASYGFNKSHAAAYAYLSYVTAYLKANYPKEWMAALMTCDKDDISKVSKFIRECQKMHIAILPPDINEAGKEFRATSEGIRFAMTAIKGVGEGVVESIFQEREANGHFDSLYQFIERVDHKAVGKKIIENLIDAGAFDFTSWNRDELKAALEPMYDSVGKEKKEKEKGYMSLFSLIEDKQEKNPFLTPPKIETKTLIQDILFKEKELLGFFLTGHPMNFYKDIIHKLDVVTLGEIPKLKNGSIFKSAFIIETVKIRISAASQKKFAIINISDGIDRYELPIWSFLYQENASLIVENQIVCAVLQVEENEGIRKLSCNWIGDLNQSEEELLPACNEAFEQSKKFAKKRSKSKINHTNKVELEKPKPESYQVSYDINSLRLSHILKIKQVFRTFAGDNSICIEFMNAQHSIGSLNIPSNWGIEMNQTIIRLLESIPGFISLEKIASD